MNTVWQQYIGRHYHVTEEHCATDFLSVSCQRLVTVHSPACQNTVLLFLLSNVYTICVANVHRQGVWNPKTPLA